MKETGGLVGVAESHVDYAKEVRDKAITNDDLPTRTECLREIRRARRG
jgi:hypothetical protein